jgi:hypothetical protein
MMALKKNERNPLTFLPMLESHSVLPVLLRETRCFGVGNSQHPSISRAE